MSFDARATVVIVPTFHPDEAVLRNISSFFAQADRVIVVDDGSGASYDAILEAAANLGAEVLRSGENNGIAAAINRGAAHALQSQSTKFILTVDQDSQLSAGYVESAIRTFSSASRAAVRVGAVSASHIASWRSTVERSESGFPVPAEPIQSGMLVDEAVWRKLGGLTESLFIDGVDEDFALRIRAAGWSIVCGEGCKLQHSLGDRTLATVCGTPIKVGSRTFSFSYHGPERRYYITRNRVILFRRFTRQFPQWAARKMVAEVKSFTLCLIFGGQRKRQLRAFVAGLRDGRRGVGGRISDRQRRFISNR